MEDPSGIAMSNITAATPVSPTAIRGQVVEVAGELVTISVGEADGVRKNMVFVIHRDDKYVGDLKITLVDPGQAAGRLYSATGTPVTGDMVTGAADGRRETRRTRPPDDGDAPAAARAPQARSRLPAPKADAKLSGIVGD